VPVILPHARQIAGPVPYAQKYKNAGLPNRVDEALLQSGTRGI
jgi:hypothetical protein